MALLKKGRYSQGVQAVEFIFNVTDTMVATDGSTKSFAAGGTFNITEALPPGFQLVGGEAVTEVAVSGGGVTAFTTAIGDSASGARYAAAASSLAAGARIPLIGTGYSGQGENLQITTVNTGGAPTAGKIRVRALFIIEGRSLENL